MQPDEVAEGVYRLGTKWVNFYIVREAEDVTIVDAGYPHYWNQLTQALHTLRLTIGSIAATVITHHHIDHVGTAERVRATSGARILVRAGDSEKVAGRVPSHPPSGFYRHAWRPRMIQYLAHTVAAGGASYRPVSSLETVSEDSVLDIPGRPRLIATPGHTKGHCSVSLDQGGVLFSGDAMVNFDYGTGETQPKLHRFNEDRDAALSSLDQLDHVEADVVLFGHGDPWRNGLHQALERVRDRAVHGP